MNRRLSRIFLTAALLLSATGVGAQDFNPNKLEEHVEFLCKSSLKGRKAGTAGEIQAAHYLYDQLKACGVEMISGRDGQVFTIAQKDTVVSRNIIGIVEGYDPVLRNEYIVIGCHIDALGTSPLTVNGVRKDQVFQGADDDASGVAVMIETAREVVLNSFMFARSVVFVGFGASEQGFAGSWYFVNRAFSEIGNVKIMIDLDMLGRGNEANPLSVHTTISHSDLNYILSQVSEMEPILPNIQIGSGEMTPSDFLPFHEKNIPFLLLTTGMTREYRTVRDTPKLVIYPQMSTACAYAFYLAEYLSTAEKIPQGHSATEVKPTGGVDGIYAVSECTKPPKFFNSNINRFLDDWIYKYRKYPAKAIEQGIQGKVVVSFIVEKDGTVSNVEIVDSPHVLLEEEALRVVKASPKWTPGEVDGKKVRTRISLPVEFRLK